MAVVPPAEFDPKSVSNILSSDAVLSHPFPWDTFHSAQFIDDKEMDLVKKYDKKSPETQESLLAQRGQDIARLLLKLANNINQEDKLQYILAHIDVILHRKEENAKYFLAIGEPYPFQPFSRILKRSSTDHFISSKASQALSILLVHSPHPPEEVVQEVLRWSSDQLRRQSKDDQSIGLSSLQILLRSKNFRVLFAAEDGINKLAGILKENMQNTQILYDALYCLWLLSYSDDIAAQFDKSNVISKIVDVAKVVAKEKCIRMSLAILKNILNKGQNNEIMIDSGFVKVLDNLNQRKWADQDMIEDMETLQKSMESGIEERSSWDMYKAEVYSGNLEWTPVHKNDKFWRENIMRFEDNNFQVLGVLCDLLNKQNPVTLAVGCHDLGQFITIHPRGRQIISQLGAKTQLMKLMINSDAEVQKQALLCVQKLMVQNWEYLAR